MFIIIISTFYLHCNNSISGLDILVVYDVEEPEERDTTPQNAVEVVENESSDIADADEEEVDPIP